MLRIFVRYNSRHGNRRILNSTDQVYQDCTQNSGHCPYSMFYFHRMCLEKRVKIFMSMPNKFSQILKAVRQRLTLHSVTFAGCFTSFSRKSIVTSVSAMSRYPITFFISATLWTRKVAIKSVETRNAFLTTQDRITVLTIFTSQTTVFAISISFTQFAVRSTVARQAVSTS